MVKADNRTITSKRETIMKNTKEQILEAALELFSKNGYDATSMSDIAKPLNISKAALYKHYSGKQQIFDAIIEESSRKSKVFSEAMNLHMTESVLMGNPEKVDVDAYSRVSGEQLAAKVIEFVTFMMNDPYTRQVRHMLTIEQFRNPDFGNLYSQRYVETMLKYNENLFRRFMEMNVMKKDDPLRMAEYFCAPVFMYMGIWDREPEREEECKNAIMEHASHFLSMTHV